MKQGPWCKRDQGGVRIYEGRFAIMFRLAFSGVLLFPDGKLKTVLTFSLPSENGHKARSVSYYKNGHMMARGNYLDEKKDSTWQFFGEFDGALLLEENYTAGVRNGVSRTFTPTRPWLR